MGPFGTIRYTLRQAAFSSVCSGWCHQRGWEQWGAFECLDHQWVRFPSPSYTDSILGCQRRCCLGLLSHPGANLGVSVDIFLPLTKIWPASPRIHPYWLRGICQVLPPTCFLLGILFFSPDSFWSSYPTQMYNISFWREKKNRLHPKELTAVCFLILRATPDKWVTQAFHVPSGGLAAKASLVIPPAWRLGPWWIVSKPGLRLFFNI